MSIWISFTRGSGGPVSFTQPTNRAKGTGSVYPEDKNYKGRVNYEPKNFLDWYVNYSNPFTATRNYLNDTIKTGLKNGSVGNETSGFGVSKFFKDALSLSSSGSGRSGSYSSGSSDIPPGVPDYLNADLARHYGMDAATAYQEALANTSHQREVKDLQAAGLNPVLSTRYGGSSGVSGASVYAPGEPVVSGVSSANSASIVADLASGVVGLVTGSSAKSNATRSIVNALGGLVQNAFSRE